MSLIEDINKGLSDKIEGVMSQHFPEAKKHGHRWQMGNFDGDAGSSCGVYRGRGGIYLATDGDTINILNLLHRKLGGSWVDTIAEAKRICGIRSVQPVQKKPKPKPKRMTHDGIRGTEVARYWKERGIDERTLVKYDVRQQVASKLPPTKDTRWNEHYSLFPFRDSQGQGVMYKWIGTKKNDLGKKEIGTTFPQYATLWGWPIVTNNDRSIMICEGEGDALSLAQMQSEIPVLSVTSGVSNLGWIDNDFERLEMFETIYICMDMDDAGEQAAQKIAKRLGLARCFRISLPEGYKDANEYLQSKEHEKPSMEQLIKEAKTYDPQAIVSIQDGADGALARQAEMDDAMKDRTFLFPKMNFKMIPKDTGILQGQVGHGKTDFATAVMLNEIRRGEVGCIVACDTPWDDLIILCAWIMAGRKPNATDINQAKDILTDRLFFLDGVTHPLTSKEVLEQMEYCVRRFGVTRFQIDNLSEIADIGKDAYDKQDTFVRDLDKFDKRNGTNSLLVAHSLMSDSSEWRIPGRRDVEGSKGMVKPIQYGMTIFRNKVKEKPEDYDEGKDTNRRIQRFLEGSDSYLSMWKQRNGFREEFEAGLKFSKSARWFAPEFEKFASPYPLYATEQSEADIKTNQPMPSGDYAEIPY